MKFIKKFESYGDKKYPPREEMITSLCGCGYNKEECDCMTYDQLCDCWERENESKKYSKEYSYKDSGLDKPELADFNKDKVISEYEKRRGSAIEKSMKKRKRRK